MQNVFSLLFFIFCLLWQHFDGLEAERFIFAGGVAPLIRVNRLKDTFPRS